MAGGCGLDLPAVVVALAGRAVVLVPAAGRVAALLLEVVALARPGVDLLVVMVHESRQRCSSSQRTGVINSLGLTMTYSA